MMRILAGAAAFFAIAAFAVPAVAGDNPGHTPPGNPCGKDNGNPCNGNQGNSGSQGNSGHSGVTIGTPGPIDISHPVVTDRGAYITQIGSANTATMLQTTDRAFARIDQSGAGNIASSTQAGTTVAYLQASQSGNANIATAMQNGAGANAAFLTQTGNGNNLALRQSGLSGRESGAILAQAGNDNTLTLAQNGSDNLAQLTQNGDGNSMSASQTGVGNRLIWTQTGNHLADLSVSQQGGQAIQISQRN